MKLRTSPSRRSRYQRILHIRFILFPTGVGEIVTIQFCEEGIGRSISVKEFLFEFDLGEDALDVRFVPEEIVF
jgi:hypothetical protein